MVNKDMDPLEIIYLEKRKSSLHSELKIARESFEQKKIKRKQMDNTESSISARVSEIEKLFNLSRSISTFNQEDITRFCDSLLLEENKNLKEQLHKEQLKNKTR